MALSSPPTEFAKVTAFLMSAIPTLLLAWSSALFSFGFAAGGVSTVFSGSFSALADPSAGAGVVGGLVAVLVAVFLAI